MLRSLLFVGVFVTFSCATGSRAQAPSDAPKPAAGSQQPAPGASVTQTQTPAKAENAGTPADPAGGKDQTKKKPKKVWTNEEMSSIQGQISVVGDPARTDATASRKLAGDLDTRNPDEAEPQNAAANYREQLRQLREQVDDIDKKIADFRNFKADNSSPSGGINVRKGYSMAPADDAIKQLEDKRKQIQDKIDALEEEARKNGIEPGEIR